MYEYVYVCVYICIYIYICICVHTRNVYYGDWPYATQTKHINMIITNY